MNRFGCARQLRHSAVILAALLIGAAATSRPLRAQEAVRSQDPSALGPSIPDSFHELETKYIFGFTEGADIDEEGERAVEFETTGTFGKRSGSYNGIDQEIEFENTPSQFWEYELSAHVSTYDISGVGGVANVKNINFSGLSSEFRYLIIGRGPGSPFGLTLTAAPEWARIDDIGQPIVDFSTTFKIVADTEIIPNRFYAAANLIYAPEIAQSPGEDWQRFSTLGATTALAYRFTPKITAGGEVEYYRASNIVVFQSLQGQALYLGPTLQVQLSSKIMLAAAFSTEVAGHAIGDNRYLDLTNFPRNRANLKVEFEF